MKIASIDYIKVYVPWKTSFAEPMRRWRAMNGTTPEDEDAYVLIRVRTDEGLVGWGEGGRSLDEVRTVGDRLLGQNPMALDAHNLQPPFLHAVFDLAGQALGVPAGLLLGGRFRDEVPLAFWSPYLPPTETAKLAEEGAAAGFKVHKIKARPHDCAEQVQAISESAGPDYAIRIDPNETFRLPATTMRIDQEIAEYNVECLEDPVPKAHPEWYAMLRQKCYTPLAVHTHDPELILRMARLDATDYVNVGGTPSETRAAAAVAQAAGCPVWVQSEGHCLEIAAAFNIHLAAALPNATLPADILHFLREAPITREPLVPIGGMVRVPEGPGLGIEVDEAALQAYRVG